MTSIPGQPGEQRAGEQDLGAPHPRADKDDVGADHLGVDKSCQPLGQPDGVMPPYSMPVSSTARSIARKEALRTSRYLRTTPFMSARPVASTTQAARRSAPLPLPPTTTQFASAPGATP